MLLKGAVSNKKLWSVVNSLAGRKGHSNIPVIENNGIVHMSARFKASVFCQTFAEKCRLHDADDESPIIRQFTTNKQENVTFKVKDIKRILQTLNPDKASGPDLISTSALKECCVELASPPCWLFYLSSSFGVFPEKSGRLHLLHQCRRGTPKLIYKVFSVK